MWFVASSASLKESRRLLPHFDAQKAYRGAEPLNSKKYNDVMKMAQKYVMFVHPKLYNKLTNTHNSLSQDMGMGSDVLT
jgi:hypothetical protein